MMKTMLMATMLAMLSIAGCTKAPKQPLHIKEAWARTTPAAAPVAGAFLTIANDGDGDDRLIGVESDVALRVEIHEMRMDGGMMRMRGIDGLDVPAHGKTVLAPGGYHLMLIGPKHPLVEGQRFAAVLVFANAGKIPAEFEVRGMGAGAH